MNSKFKDSNIKGEGKKMKEITQEIKKYSPHENFFLPEPPLLRTPKTIQILILRQTHDYTIFRTEETREINTVVIPKSSTDPLQTTRVAFLASKQKAPESRFFTSLFKEYYLSYKNSLYSSERDKTKDKKEQEKEENDDKSILNCELKDSLCKMCPRCVLFGALRVESQDRWSIKHRIEYSTAFSLEPYQLVAESLTFNAIIESTNSTGRALNIVENIDPVVSFPSIITLNSPTVEEFILIIKTLLGCKSYGAEGRIKGDMINYITGIVFGNEELLTSLEYCLELSSRNTINDYSQETKSILDKYKEFSSFPDRLKILDTNDTENLIEYIRKINLTDIIGSAVEKSKNFADSATKASSKS